MGTIHVLDPVRNRQYQAKYREGYERIMRNCASEPLDMLLTIRDEAAHAEPGTLTPVQRGWVDGTMNALDELIEPLLRKVGET